MSRQLVNDATGGFGPSGPCGPVAPCGPCGPAGPCTPALFHVTACSLLLQSDADPTNFGVPLLLFTQTVIVPPSAIATAAALPNPSTTTTAATIHPDSHPRGPHGE